IAMEGGSAMPYSLRVRFTSPEPASAPACKVALRASLARGEVGEGEAVDVRVDLQNRTDEGLPMVVAIIGLPGGLEAGADQRKGRGRGGRGAGGERGGRGGALSPRNRAPRGAASTPPPPAAGGRGRYGGPAPGASLYYTEEEKPGAPP